MTALRVLWVCPGTSAVRIQPKSLWELWAMSLEAASLSAGTRCRNSHPSAFLQKPMSSITFPLSLLDSFCFLHPIFSAQVPFPLPLVFNSCGVSQAVCQVAAAC